MELLLYNGKIYQGEGRFTEALYIKDGIVDSYGSNRDMLARAGESAERIDLKGRLATPGFNDSHMHLFGIAAKLMRVDLADCSGIEDMIERFKAGLAGRESGSLVIGRGWNQAFFTDEQRTPDRFDLDRVSSDVGIIAIRVCGHVVSCNTRALELAGITADSAVPSGEIVLGPDGRPNGILLEGAGGLALNLIADPTPAELDSMLRGAIDYASSIGLTSVQTDDIRGRNSMAIYETYKNIFESGLRKIRISHQVRFGDVEPLKEYLDTFSFKEEPSFHRAVAVKMLIDGSLGGRTGLLSRPYADEPTTCGIATMSQEKLDEMTRLCHEHGKAVIIHCIGDGGADMVLSSFARLNGEGGPNTLRHGIVHCQITRQDQLERIKKNDILVYAQPVFINSDWLVCADRVGPELERTSYAYGSMLRDGVHLSYGTDAPVESARPIDNIHCAVNRTDLRNRPEGGYLPLECVSVHEAVDAYTAASAYASGEELVKGKLLPGFYADVVVLDRDIFTVDPLTINQTEVAMTVTAGRIVYKR